MFQQAFVTHEMIECTGEPVAAVVRAKRLSESGRVVIQIAPLYPPPGLQDLFITVDSEDLAEVQKLIGEQRHDMSNGTDPDPARVLAIAKRALGMINRFDRLGPNDSDLASWKQIAHNCIDIADDALFEIGMMENCYGTPTDS